MVSAAAIEMHIALINMHACRFSQAYHKTLLQCQYGAESFLLFIAGLLPKNPLVAYKQKDLYSAYRNSHKMLSMLCRLSKHELRWVESMLQSKQFAIIPSMPVRCRAGLIEPYSITTHFLRAIKLCNQRFRSSGIQLKLAPLIHCGP